MPRPERLVLRRPSTTRTEDGDAFCPSTGSLSARQQSRMPVILEQSGYNRWLGNKPDLNGRDEARIDVQIDAE